MIVPNSVAWALAAVTDPLVVWIGFRKGLAYNGSADISFVTQQRIYGSFAPFILAGRGFDSSLRKLANDEKNAMPLKI